jgi:hypothetical protein
MVVASAMVYNEYYQVLQTSMQAEAVFANDIWEQVRKIN